MPVKSDERMEGCSVEIVKIIIEWLSYNFFLALLLPLLLVIVAALVLSENGIRPFRDVRNFHVCLYCTTLIAATIYDVNMKRYNTSEEELRELLKGAYTLNLAMITILMIASFFYGVSVCFSSLSSTDTRKHDRRELKIVIASAVTVGLTLIVVIWSRMEVGLL